jgi:hypothetical protein
MFLKRDLKSTPESKSVATNNTIFFIFSGLKLQHFLNHNINNRSYCNQKIKNVFLKSKNSATSSTFFKVKIISFLKPWPKKSLLLQKNIKINLKTNTPLGLVYQWKHLFVFIIKIIIFKKKNGQYHHQYFGAVVPPISLYIFTNAFSTKNSAKL